MTTLHEQAVEAIHGASENKSSFEWKLDSDNTYRIINFRTGEVVLTGQPSAKQADLLNAGIVLQALLSLIKDNEELVYDIAGKMAKEDVKSTNDAVRFTLAALTKALGDGE